MTRLIAVEEHFDTPANEHYASAILSKAPGAVQRRLRALLQDPYERLAAMDAAGIDVALVSQTSPGVQVEPDAAAAVRAAVLTNDALRTHIDVAPTRLFGFAHLALHDATAAAGELERCVRELDFRGALINGPTLDVPLHDAALLPFWERAAGLGVPVFLHPAPALTPDPRYAGHEPLAGAMWGWGVDVATQVLRLIMAGMFDKLPALQLVVGHMGELLPFTLDRLDSRYAVALDQGWKPLAHDTISHYVRTHVTIATSGVLSRAALRCSIDTLGVDRILFATDYPYEDVPASTAFLRDAPLMAHERVAISHGNAERLFRL